MSIASIVRKSPSVNTNRPRSFSVVSQTRPPASQKRPVEMTPLETVPAANWGLYRWRFFDMYTTPQAVPTQTEPSSSSTIARIELLGRPFFVVNVMLPSGWRSCTPSSFEPIHMLPELSSMTARTDAKEKSLSLARRRVVKATPSKRTRPS